ncbi:GntR family transcriptional regulator [Laceyella tengchongensis]
MSNSKIDEVVKIIHERIIEGKYVAGQRLPAERVLAEELGVSPGQRSFAFNQIISSILYLAVAFLSVPMRQK